MTILHYHQLLL